SGPGINGPFTNNAENIATVPGTNVPVAINTVNSGTSSSGNTTPCDNADPNWQANSIYFTTGYNTLFQNSAAPMSGFNGGTVVLPANATLSCGDTFHIKLAIANDFDTGLDSGVFLEAKSFTSNVIQIGSDSGQSVNVLDSVLIEGCSEGMLTFIRPDGVDINDTIVGQLTFNGAAVQGDDFNQLVPGDSVVILPGVDTLFVPLFPTDDGNVEGMEDITITVTSITDCGDTVHSDITFYIDDEPYSTVSTNDTTLYCLTDSAFLYAETNGGFAPYEYVWVDGGTSTHVGDSIWYSELEQGTNEIVVESTDDCGFTYLDTAIVEMDQSLSIDTLIQYMASCGEDDGAVSGQGSGFTGTPGYEWSGPGPNNPNNQDASVWPDLSSGWYYFSIEDDVCTVNDSIFLEQEPPPNADFTADPTLGAPPLTVNFTNESDNADTYDWNFGNGDSISVNDLSDQSSVYNEEGVYTVTLVITEGSCTNEATEEIVVILDFPLEYDMPNVFTPNNDGSNDEFTLNTKNAESLEIVILNRWGNVVFESSDVDAAWNGRVKNSGAECGDGTYFYKFTIAGEDGKEIEEHGFVQLVRD
ncbi:MAG: gliding motility-associated C-terminal domain-containing protein, partial [Brumimicrobium sp.]